VGFVDGLVCVGGVDEVVVVSPSGEALCGHRVDGLERLVGSRAGLAWLRTVGDRTVVGTGVPVGARGGDCLRAVVEADLPGHDEFPEVAVVEGLGAVVVAGGPGELRVHRLDRGRWAEPVDVPLS
jgi:hypothetical protein